MVNIKNKKSVAIIGARGYVGLELIKILAQHAYVDIVAVSSRSAAGEKVEEIKNKEISYQDLNPQETAELKADIVFLALPNNLCDSYVQEINKLKRDSLIIDLSFDNRLKDNSQVDSTGYPWVYGLSELNSSSLSFAKRIANPGCYATAAQLALHPLKKLITGTPNVFGVSGYSGAGSTPSEKNDPNNLKDNFLPYSLANHLHESEISKHCGHKINFMPHVAPHFRGLSVTLNIETTKSFSDSLLYEHFTETYRRMSLVRVQKKVPTVKEISGQHGAIIGGFSVDKRSGKNLRLVSVVDNLLKGAATQAVQNMNIAIGLDSLTGLDID